MRIIMMVDCTKYEYPVDVALTCGELAKRHNLPLQTVKNRLCDGKPIKYLGCRLIAVNVPKEDETY